MADINQDIIYSDQDSDDVSLDSELIPKEVRKINTQAYDKSISDIVRMIEEKDILLSPEFQRQYIWDNKKSSLLIESIILNVPIPVIYVSQEVDDTWTVIDGLQRLTALQRFFNNDFKLIGLEVLSELNGKDYTTLNIRAQRMLKNGLLRIIMITSDSHPEIKYDVFMRLNTGSVHLTEQELRNCLYRGPFNEMLKNLVKNAYWLKLLGRSDPHKRMADRELILRFFAISEYWNPSNGEVNNYKGRMKSFLNDYMRKYQHADKALITNKCALFEQTVEKVLTVYGENPFKIGVAGKSENAINRSVMDIFMLSVTQYELERLKEKKDVILHHFDILLQSNSTFENSLKLSTSSTKVLNYRLKTWSQEMNIILNN